MKRSIAIFAGQNIMTLGGGEKYSIELANRLIKRGHKVTIFSNNITTGAKTTHEGIKSLTKANIVYYSAVNIPILREHLPLSRFSEVKDADVVYNMDSGVAMNVLLPILCNKFKKRYIFGIHDPGFFRKEPLKRSVLKSASISSYNTAKRFAVGLIKNVHAINEYQAKNLRALGYKGKIFNIPIFLYYKVKSSQVKVNKKEFIVFILGRFDLHQKGIDFLETIVKSTVAKNRKIKFVVIGKGGTGESTIKKLSREYKNNFVWLGFGSEKQKQDCYKNASLFIMPSRSEGFPAVLLEAQIFGLPVVAFKIPGPEDIVKSRLEGTLIPKFNVKMFINALTHYSDLWESDKKKYLNMKQKISRITYERYKDEKTVDKMEKMFEG